MISMAPMRRSDQACTGACTHVMFLSQLLATASLSNMTYKSDKQFSMWLSDSSQLP